MPATPSHRSRTVLVANPSADLYGSDRMMVEAVAGLVERGWRTVVVVSRTGPLVGLLEEVGAEVSVCPAPVVRKANLTPRGMADLLRDVRRGLPVMRALLRSVRPDVVYVSTVTVPFWLLVARAARVPVAVHVHEAESSVPALARWGLAAPNLLADRVIYNSRTSERVGRSVPFHRDTATVVYNGVRGPSEVTPPRGQVAEPELLFVGRLSPRKGVDVAVRALALLRERGVRARLTVVGAVFPGYEWFEDELRRLVEAEGLGASVTFTGFLTDVWGALAQTDIVLVPSRSEESFGNAVIEGSLAARPVVVSDHTGLREARQGLDAAVPVPPDDPSAIADAVQRIVEEWPVYRARALADAGEAARRHSLPRYRDEVEAVLSGLVASG
jgi:hypothetical protein